MNTTTHQKSLSKLRPSCSPPHCFDPRSSAASLAVEPDLSFSLLTPAKTHLPSRIQSSSTADFQSTCGARHGTDRFIPSRRSDRMRSFMEDYSSESQNFPNSTSQAQQNSICSIYKKHVLNLNGVSNFEFSSQENNCSSSRVSFYSKNTGSFFSIPDYMHELRYASQLENKNIRKIPKTPFKVLDAPALQDDFYLNLIDWSQNNILAVGLGSAVYLWSPETGKVTKLCDLTANSISSLVWLKKNHTLAIGTNSGELQLWDSSKLQKVRSYTGHTARIGSLAESDSLLTSGSKDKTILTRDIRESSKNIWKLTGHKQQICGLKWSPDSQQLASGGNDNKLFLWNLHSTNPIYKFNDHNAAVKALAWSPHQHGLLASGGGTADKTIRFWNALEGKQINCVDTGSQVCSLMFSKTVNEIVSTHGYSQNHITIWRYPDMTKLTSLQGHTTRVLYLAMSPDGKTIVTGAGDETLRFWNVFPALEESIELETSISKDSVSLR